MKIQSQFNQTEQTFDTLFTFESLIGEKIDKKSFHADLVTFSSDHLLQDHPNRQRHQRQPLHADQRPVHQLLQPLPFDREASATNDCKISNGSRSIDRISIKIISQQSYPW